MTGRRDLVVDWTIRLATDATEGEAILAPAIAEAWLAGGKKRHELLTTANSVPGGFGSGAVLTVLPAILESISLAAPLILTALSSPFTGSLVNVVDNSLELLALAKHRPLPADDAVPQGSPPGPTLPARDISTLLAAIDTMQSELAKHGVDNETCEAAAFRVMRTILLDPIGARPFVDALAQEGKK